MVGPRLGRGLLVGDFHYMGDVWLFAFESRSFVQPASVLRPGQPVAKKIVQVCSKTNQPRTRAERTEVCPRRSSVSHISSASHVFGPNPLCAGPHVRLSFIATRKQLYPFPWVIQWGQKILPFPQVLLWCDISRTKRTGRLGTAVYVVRKLTNLPL